MTLEVLYQILVSERKCQGALYNYITEEVTPPSYFYTSWIDWVHPFVLDRLRICKEYHSSDSNKRENEIAVRLLSLLEEQEKILKERKSNQAESAIVQQDSTDVSQLPGQANLDQEIAAAND